MSCPLLVAYEHMFATSEMTVDQVRERRREARRCELRSLCEQEARIKQEQRAGVINQLLNEANQQGEKTNVETTPVKEVAPAK